MDDGVVSGSEVVSCLDLSQEPCVQEKGLLFLGPFYSINVDSI